MGTFITRPPPLEGENRRAFNNHLQQEGRHQANILRIFLDSIRRSIQGYFSKVPKAVTSTDFPLLE